MYVFWFAVTLALAFLWPQNPTSDEVARARERAAALREQSIELNDLLGRIQSESDAQTAVDSVAKLFADDLPPAWATRSVRRRVAHAEYMAVADPSRLIPEQRIADVWNEYVRQIGAPDDALVTAAEIHNMRDGEYVGAQALWTRDLNRSIWTMPNLFAVGPDGKVANGCRALDALRVTFELENMFQNLYGARERVKRGIVLSDEIKKQQESSSAQRRSVLTIGTALANPIYPAERQYIAQHGFVAFNRLLADLFDQLFPE